MTAAEYTAALERVLDVLEVEHGREQARDADEAVPANAWPLLVAKLKIAYDGVSEDARVQMVLSSVRAGRGSGAPDERDVPTTAGQRITEAANRLGRDDFRTFLSRSWSIMFPSGLDEAAGSPPAAPGPELARQQGQLVSPPAVPPDAPVDPLNFRFRARGRRYDGRELRVPVPPSRATMAREVTPASAAWYHEIVITLDLDGYPTSEGLSPSEIDTMHLWLDNTPTILMPATMADPVQPDSPGISIIADEFVPASRTYIF